MRLEARAWRGVMTSRHALFGAVGLVGLAVLLFAVDRGAAEAQTCPTPSSPPLTKQDRKDPVRVGRVASWVIIATNHACATADVTVTDSVPSNFGSVSTLGANWQCVVTGNDVTCSYYRLPGQKRSQPLRIRAVAVSCGTPTNTAHATFTFSGGSPPNLGQDSETTTISC